MMRALVLIPALAMIAACSDPSDRILFDGKAYKGRIQADKDDRRSFVATAGPVSQGLEGAREAARYEGTTYCVRNYGRSDIDWTLSPEAEATGLQIAEDLMTVQGRCAE